MGRGGREGSDGEEGLLIPTAEYVYDPDEGLHRMGCMFEGVVDDYQRRMPFYKSDFSDAWTSKAKTISSSFYMFFISAYITITLGINAEDHTRCPRVNDAGGICIKDCWADCEVGTSYLGLTEFLLCTSMTGMMHSMFGCQPLCLLRPPGVIVAFSMLAFKISKDMETEFLHIMAWTGMGVGVFMVIIAAFEISRYIKVMSRYLHEIFSFFVCSLYVVDGIAGVNDRFYQAEEGKGADEYKSLGAAYFMVIMAVFVCVGAMLLYDIKRTTLGRYGMRASLANAIRDNSLTIAVMMTIFISYLPQMQGGNHDTYVERVHVNEGVGGIEAFPTIRNADRSRRNWFIDWYNADADAILIGVLFSIPITIFFYFDQNFGSLLAQTREMNLRKGSYYHSTMLWMGMFNIIVPMFGMPMVIGAIPDSNQMINSLREDPENVLRNQGDPTQLTASSFDYKADDETGDSCEPHNLPVFENRVAPTIMYALMGAIVLFPGLRDMLECMPKAAMYGVLVYVGLEGMFPCQLFHRITLLWYKDESEYPPIPDGKSVPAYMRLPAKRTNLFTYTQLSWCVASWLFVAISMSDTGGSLVMFHFAFPVLIIFLVPFKLHILPKIFTTDELDALDGVYNLRNSSRLDTSSTRLGTSGAI